MELLTEGFGRITELYDGVAEGLDDASSSHHRPGGTGNPIGWLLWHLARVQDDHIADLAGQPQVWERFQDRFGLPNGTDDIGYGHTSEQVDALRIEDAGTARGLPPRGDARDRALPADRRRGGARARGRPAAGTRRSPPAYGWSASRVTACSTSGRLPTSRVFSVRARPETGAVSSPTGTRLN